MADNVNPTSGPRVVGITVRSTVTIQKTVKHGDKVVSSTTSTNSSTQKIEPGPRARADVAAAIARGLGTGNLHDLDTLLNQAAAQTSGPLATPPVPSLPAAPSKSAASAVLDSALAFPPKPKRGAEQKAWLMDAYSRLLKAEAAGDAMMHEWSAGTITKEDVDPVRQRLWRAQNMVAGVDKDGAVKKEFFAAIVPPALAVFDALDAVPAPPADKAGKQAWLESGKRQLQEAQVADQLLRDTWFDFSSLPFGVMTEKSRQLSNFERRLATAERELAAPPPAPLAPASRPAPAMPSQPGAIGPTAPTARPRPNQGNGALFGNSQGVSNALNRHPNSPVVQVGAAIAMPIAITIDVLDALTRPFVWLGQVTGSAKK